VGPATHADSLLLPLLGTGFFFFFFERTLGDRFIFLSAKVLYSAVEDEAPRTRLEQDSTKVMYKTLENIFLLLVLKKMSSQVQ
jgi:hypothetical protein